MFLLQTNKLNPTSFEHQEKAENLLPRRERELSFHLNNIEKDRVMMLF